MHTYTHFTGCSFSLSALISDGEDVLNVVLTDNFVQQLTGETCEKIIVSQGYDERKAVPPPIQQHLLRPYYMTLEVTKNSSADKLSYAAITMSKDRDTQPIEAISLTYTTDQTVEQFQIPTTTSLSSTPPPHGSATKGLGSPDVSDITTPPGSKASVAKQLDFDTPSSLDQQVVRRQPKRAVQESQG